jgi:hypothetical protein
MAPAVTEERFERHPYLFRSRFLKTASVSMTDEVPPDKSGHHEFRVHVPTLIAPSSI